MSDWSWPKFRYDKSIAIVGPKGSGKSEILATAVRTVKNAVVFDTKRSEHWERVGMILENDSDVWRIRNGRFVFRVPRWFSASDEKQSQLFLSLLDCKGPRITALDEAYNYYDTLGLKLLATQGRSARKGLMIAAQRPFGFGLYCLSEADHFFIFSLLLERDRKRIEEVTGGAKIPWEALARVPHGFVHFEPGKPVSKVIKLDKRDLVLGKS